jgi:hypothetical protein
MWVGRGTSEGQSPYRFDGILPHHLLNKRRSPPGRQRLERRSYYSRRPAATLRIEQDLCPIGQERDRGFYGVSNLRPTKRAIPPCRKPGRPPHIPLVPMFICWHGSCLGTLMGVVEEAHPHWYARAVQCGSFPRVKGFVQEPAAEQSMQRARDLTPWVGGRKQQCSRGRNELPLPGLSI